jgi:hypothetical protein
MYSLEYGKHYQKKNERQMAYISLWCNGIKDRTNEFVCRRTSIIVGRKALLEKSIILKRSFGHLM